MGSAHSLHRWLGSRHQRDVAIWHETNSSGNVLPVCHAHRFALKVLRTGERHRQSALSPAELIRRVAQRMNRDLGINRGTCDQVSSAL